MILIFFHGFQLSMEKLLLNTTQINPVVELSFPPWIEAEIAPSAHKMVLKLCSQFHENRSKQHV